MDIVALQHQIANARSVAVRGAATKQHTSPGPEILDMRGLSGVLDYQPGEFIIQAYAGTPVRDVQALLAARGQYLPFDPMLVEHGATLGGTVAANASGPERYRYGGVRDFIIGCHYIDGRGELLSGGGKVVKNAAGFDTPKLMVGSMGTLGILTDVCFKVFPLPESYQTVIARFPNMAEALRAHAALTLAPLDFHAIEMAPDAAGVRLEVRVGGLADGLAARLERVRALAGGGDILAGSAEHAHWATVRELRWCAGAAVKAPVTPALVPALEAAFGADSAVPVARRYSAGANALWLDAPERVETGLQAIDRALTTLGLAGRVFGGAQRGRRLGAHKANPFMERVKFALDPQGKFGAIP